MKDNSLMIPSTKEMLSFENGDYLTSEIYRFYHYQSGSLRVWIDINRKGFYVVKVKGRICGWQGKPTTFWTADSLPEAINIFYHYILQTINPIRINDDEMCASVSEEE